MFRGATKLGWTAVTELPARLRARRRASAEHLQRATERFEASERHAAEIADQGRRLDALEERTSEAENAVRCLEALERLAADLQGVITRLAALEQRASEAQHAATRLEALEHRAAALRADLSGERDRLDWALGTLEGVTALVDAYHAYRETEEYRTAYTTADPLVSICVGTVDRAALLLERCIPSLLAQTYSNLQIVVVGDACTDDTMQRLAGLRDSRVQFFNLPERGPYPRPGIDRWRVAGTNSLNHALSLCEGHFVTHVDDDDSMEPRRIETLLAAARQNQADFLWHAFWYQTPDGGWLRLGNGHLELGQVTTGAIFYHRYFARFPWDLYAYRLGEPGDWNRLRKIRLLRPRLHYVDEPLLHHFKERSQPDFIARGGERFLE